MWEILVLGESQRTSSSMEVLQTEFRKLRRKRAAAGCESRKRAGLQYTLACLEYTRRTTSHHAAPWRAVLRSTVRINSHQFAPREQCSIFCARPRDFAAARLRLQAKLGLFHCFRPKRTVENFSSNQWALLSFIFFLFLHFFRCFSGENSSFVLQIVQFPRTWCSNHFVSYFEIQILHVSKFFNHFRGNSNLQKMRKRKKEEFERREPQTKQRTKNEKPIRSFFLHASAILISFVLVHLCVVNRQLAELLSGNEVRGKVVIAAMQKAVNFARSLSTWSRKVCWAPFHPDSETF